MGNGWENRSICPPEIREYEEHGNTRMDPITQQHVEIHQARQPDGTEFTMPNDNTTRQAIFLNKWREKAAREGEEGMDEEGQVKNSDMTRWLLA